MAVDYFLKLEGIEGESDDANLVRPGWARPARKTAMNTTNTLTLGSSRPHSLIEFLLGDGTSTGWLDRALARASLNCSMKSSPAVYTGCFSVAIARNEASDFRLAPTRTALCSPGQCTHPLSFMTANRSDMDQ